jgi:Ni,Fe-hydrogenase maturation factor
MRLHEYHARNLEATLSRADESIDRMEHLLIDGGQDGIVRKIRGHLSQESREALLEGVRSLRALLNSIVQTFSLEPHPLDLRRVLHAELSQLWVSFENCRPARMKGYGQEFAKEARETIDKNIEALLAEISKLREQLK